MEWLEFGKLFGFPSLCLAVVGFGLWRAARWFAVKIAEPLCDDVRGAVRAAAPAAVQLRDDVQEIKERTLRIEQRQDEHYDICAGTARPKLA